MISATGIISTTFEMILVAMDVELTCFYITNYLIRIAIFFLHHLC